MSVSSILNIARNALSATQMSLQTTSHNIANVDTEGYSRQEAVLDEMVPTPTAAGMMGNGVTVKTIIRYYDSYIDTVIANKNMDLSEQKVNSKYLSRIESIFNEDNSQLSTNITNFFGAWHELAQDPTSDGARQTVASTGDNLATVIKSMYGDLTSIKSEVNDYVATNVDDINRMTSSIASLNELIFESNASGGGAANDYMDQRTKLVKELSGKIGIVTFEDSRGRVNILTSSGRSLVDGATSWNLTKIQDPQTGVWKVGWMDTNGKASDITDQITGGELKAYIDIRDQQISGFIDDLDGLAKSVIENVNYVHEQGNDNAGIDFFKPMTSGYARDISLSDAVKGSVQNIMISSTTANSTDNDIALRIGSLVDDNPIFGTTVTSQAFNSTSTPLNISGYLAINGEQISVGANDTLVNVANSINAKTALTGVTATIKTEGSRSKLVLTGAASDLHVSLMNGNLDPSGESLLGTLATTVPASDTTALNFHGRIELGQDVAALPPTHYFADISTTDTLQDVRNKINALTGPPGSGISATITNDTSGYHLNLFRGATPLSIDGDTTQGLGFDGASYVNYTAGMVSNVGEMSKGAAALEQYHQDTMAGLEQQRETVSGVSLDDEMANLIKFQHAYQAAARLFTVADELLQSLLTSVGAS
jgi:flagellar hook-associated protein 1